MAKRGEMVSNEAAEAFVEGFEKALREVGVEQPYELGKRVAQWVEENRKLFTAMQSRQALIELVRHFPDEAEPYLPLAMMLLQSVPAIVQMQMPKLLHKIADDHPVTPSPGRPQVMDDAMKLDICDDVAALFRQGIQLSASQERVAQRRGLSVRSVQRAWRERDKLKNSEPKSITHLFRAIQGLGN